MPSPSAIAFDPDPAVKYKHFKATASWTNTSDYYAVIVGAKLPAQGAGSSDTLLVVTLGGDVIDSVGYNIVTNGGVLFTMPRRMLVPPGGVVTNVGTNIMSLVLCRTLEDAAILL